MKKTTRVYNSTRQFVQNNNQPEPNPPQPSEGEAVTDPSPNNPGGGKTPPSEDN